MRVRQIAVFTLLSLTSVCNAQDVRELADQPVFIARFNGWTQAGFADYLRALNNELEVGSKIVESIEKSAAKNTVTTVAAPASGILVYMVHGLIPSVEQIQYSQVADQDEFETLVRAQQSQLGNAAVVEGSGDKFEARFKNTVRTEITDGASNASDSSENKGTPVRNVSSSTEAPQSLDSSTSEASTSDVSSSDVAEGHQSTIMIGPLGIISSEMDNAGRIVEENGRRFRESTSTISTWYRYQDGFMFSGQSNAVWDMTLPSSDLLLGQNDSELNGQITFYPDRIPKGFRQLGWDTLNAALGTYLQQQDDESDPDYAWRRAYGSSGLAMAKAIVFDTQEVSGWLKFAKDDEPICGELAIAARANSGFAKNLSDAAAADSRFAPVLNDNAAATLHFAVNLPSAWKQAADALRASYAAEVSDSGDADDRAWLDVLKSATSCSEHGTLEAMMKLGWTAESGGVIYGGLHVDDNAGLLNSFLATMRSTGTPGASIEIIEIGNLEMIRSTLPTDANAGFIRITHGYIAHAESCLWFAMGGENAHEILRSSIELCRQPSGQLRTPLLTAIVDFERLMAYPQDDPTGLTTITEYCCFLMQDLIQNYGSFGMDEEKDATNDGLSLRALQLSGSKKVGMVLTSNESGLFLRGNLGTALLRSWLAPAVQMYNESVGNMTSTDSK